MASPAEIVAEKRPGTTAVGWKLDRECRAELLAEFPPRYGNVVADHVTLASKLSHNVPLPEEVSAQAVGRADDDRGVEALVVRIAGETNRPGGGTYHITWSLGAGRRAVESNHVLAAGNWDMFAKPLPLSLTPARF